MLAPRAAVNLGAQLRVGLLQLLVLRLQVREVLLEVFDLLVLALPEGPLRLAVLCATPLLSLLGHSISHFAYVDRGGRVCFKGLHTAVCEEFLSTGVV